MEADSWGNSQIFNMGLQTIYRIDALMQKLSLFLVLKKSVPAERLIFELWKEVYPFLKAEERETAKTYWLAITKRNTGCTISTQKDYLKQHLEAIHSFDFWLRDMMYKHKLLMAVGDNPELAVQNLRS